MNLRPSGDGNPTRMVRLLDEDAELGSELSRPDFEQARRYAVAQTAGLDRGVHDPTRIGRRVCWVC